MIKKALIKLVTLICILFILTVAITPPFPHPGHVSKLHQGWYNKDASASYDVFLLGSSHMNGMVDPKVLYDQYGISSFNYATGGQPIDVTYYLLKEALKTHPNPKVVVLDLYYFGQVNEYGEDGYIRNVLDNMRFSLNKFEAINSCVPIKQRILYFFPILKYHNRWSSFTESDFDINSKLNPSFNGFEAGKNKYGSDIVETQSDSAKGYLPPKSIDYLNRFIELSKEKGFTLLFTNAPYEYSSNNSTDWYKNDSAIYNEIKKVADRNNIKFINYSEKDVMKQINFNFANDMNNAGHTNIWGANKVSLDIAKFLHQNYNLPDHRNDKKK